MKGPQKKTRQEWIDLLNEKYNFSYDYSLIPEKVKAIDKVSIICRKHGVFQTQLWAHLNKGTECPKCKLEKKWKKEFLEKAKKVHNNTYDYSKINYLGAKTKIEIICPIHGSFWQTPTSHLQGAGCPLCKNLNHGNKLRMSREEFIEKAKNVHGNKYDYSKSLYKQYRNCLEIICFKHGTFWQTPLDHLHGSKCPICARENWESEEETELKKFIESLGVKTQKKRFNNIEIDIYLPEYNIGFEYNGLYWHSELQGKGKNFHINKTELCKENNIKLIHIFSYYWKNKQEIIKSLIKKILNKTKRKIYARKCEIKLIGNNIANEFLENNHIQGNSASSVKIGLYYKNELVSIMTFGKSRFSKKYDWELVRYCNKNDVTVIGGASKMFKYFINNYNPNSIVSYCDLSLFQGQIYKDLGFTFLHNTKPNYWYFKGLNKIHHRVQFQKHKLKDKLENFDPNLTEWENMKNNGWNRYWDCGNSVWEWRKNLSK
ncbi:MAG: hypothetical protein ACOCP8_06405 [archaeon]